MAFASDVHNNGQDLNLVGTPGVGATIGANATVTSTPITKLAGAKYLAVEAVFVRAAGGGTADVYIQTSLDGGVTWIDIMNFHFTTATATKVSAVVLSTALAAAVTPGDGALASDTILSGLLGSQLRCKYVSAGTVYTGATSLAVSATVKG